MVEGGVVEEVMVRDAGNLVSVLSCGVVRDIMLPRHHLEGRGVPEGLHLIKGTVCCSQHVEGREDGASTERNVFSSQDNGNLCKKFRVQAFQTEGWL